MKQIIPQSILEILQKLQTKGFTSYLVGGCVRDFLLGDIPKDWDICTPATPEQILEIFADSITLGAKYGTIGVKSAEGIVEVTTFRTEKEYADFRHPQVQFCKDLSEDLKRRDFSINSIAYNPQIGFVDPFGGMQDLENGVLRCIGDAKERLSEDALRILRLVRFSSRFDFSPHPQTLREALLSSPKLKMISSERIRDELLKILQTPFWGKYFLQYKEIFSQTLPELTKPFTHKISNHSILFAYIFQKDQDLEALQRLKIDKITSKRVQLLFAHKHSAIPHEKIGIKLLLKEIGYDNLLALLELQKLMGKDTKKTYKTLQEIMILDECYCLKDLKINGNDLKTLGYEDKKIGEKLEDLLIKVIKGEIPNEKEKLLNYC